MTWTLDEAIRLVRDLEQLTSYHLGITGSVLFNGESEKDLDLIAYPDKSVDTVDALQIISSLGLKNPKQLEYEYDDKKVYSTESCDGRRIDIFFLL